MRKIRGLFVGVLLGLLLGPTAQILLNVFDIKGLEEYRRLAAFPDLWATFKRDGKVAKAINVWFDDNMPLRPVLTRLANQIDYSVFGHSKGVMVGRDGWLLDGAWVDYPVVRERSGDQILRTTEQQFLALARLVKRHNAKLVLLSIPMSSTIYPEILPAHAPHFSGPSQFQKLRTFLKQHDDWIYIDSQDLLEPRRNEQIYFKLDHHLTSYGSYIVVRELLRRLAEAEGRPDPWDRAITWENKTWHHGSFSRFLSILRGTGEDFPTPDRATSYDDANLPPGHEMVRGQGPFELIVTNNGPRQHKMPPLLMYGNSYADWLTSLGYYDYFSRVYRVRGNGANLSVLGQIPADMKYFVFQFIEPYFDGITQSKLPAK